MSSRQSGRESYTFRRVSLAESLKIFGGCAREFKVYIGRPRERAGTLMFVLSLCIIYWLDVYGFPSINWRLLFTLPVLSAGFYLTRRETYVISVLAAAAYTMSYQHQFPDAGFVPNFIPSFLVFAYLGKFSADAARAFVDYETYRSFTEGCPMPDLGREEI